MQCWPRPSQLKCAVSGNLGGLTLISVDVHTSSAFLAFTVLSMVFLFLTRRSYYHYYDKYYRVSSQLL